MMEPGFIIATIVAPNLVIQVGLAQHKMARVLGSIRLPLGSLGSGGMYLQTMEISTVLQLETAII